VNDRELDFRPTLPSFLLLPSAHDLDAKNVALPWNERPDAVAGVIARERGTLEPARQVSSAKSWLAHPAVDRTARLLPWGAERGQEAFSPVEASTRYLAHVRDAWNHAVASGGLAAGTKQPSGRETEELRFESQDIVLTVPASFDEEARELTVQAARDAGIDHLTLLEEPLAAFYAWIAANRQAIGDVLRDGESVLVCDVGGGTTDFSMIGVRISGGEIAFERTAIGDHLLLGGDNLDLALSRLAEEKLGGPPLSLRQRNALRRQCSAAKERLLSEPSIGHVPVTVLGTGTALVGGVRTTELTREEVAATLATFLPMTSAGDLPAREKRTGLRELGLPYATDPAITRHLAAFLTRAGATRAGDAVSPAGGDAARRMMRPDAVLFNGGFFVPEMARQRLVAAISAWFETGGEAWRPDVLSNRQFESAVAIGAAHYGRVRLLGGLRVRAGSARTYYIGVQPAPADAVGAIHAVSVMPRGTDEGTRLDLPDREFSVVTNQPVSFTLYSSTMRQDAKGDLVTLSPDEVHRHAPLVTVLRYGRKTRRIELAVTLAVLFTEVGTLELWCESRTSDHRWRLQFQLRAAEATAEDVQQDAAGARDQAAAVISEESLNEAGRLISAVFDVAGGPEEELPPEALVARLEAVTGYGKHAWPIDAIRPLSDVLADVADGRRKGPRFESRWLNLFGFCLRPGFGAAADQWRVERARGIYAGGLAFPKDVQCQVEWVVLWQRLAGGLKAGQQRELYRRHAVQLGIGGRKTKGRLNPQLERETWRLLASLEHMPVADRIALGNELAEKVRRDPRNTSYLWSLGRVGARIPFYGPLNSVVPPADASRWMEVLIALRDMTPDVASAVVQLGARTGDPLRDTDEEVRQKAIEAVAGVAPQLVPSLREYIPPGGSDALRIFGESLPEGLRLAVSE
jgi:hypothetical protein